MEYPKKPSAPDTLALGACGEAVAVLQRSLERLRRGRYPELLALAADGVYGHATATAVQQYQSLAGLPVDGVAGPRCQASIAADCERLFLPV